VKLEPGREIDTLVAEKVMEFKWWRWHDIEYASPDGPLRRTLTDVEDWLCPPEYAECDLSDPAQMALEAYGPITMKPGGGLVDFSPSTDIKDAFKVAFKIHDEQPTFKLEFQPFVRPRNFWCEMYGTGIVNADSAEMAICLAALKYKGVELEE